jgi:putative transposase
MARKLRLQFEGAFYHVYGRGNRREKTFLDDADYCEFENIVFENSHQEEINLYSWCPMPNHYHLALETPRANLALFMQSTLSSYARYFNAKYGKVGHVFQSRYASKLVDREHYLLELIRYIDLNPYRVKNPNWVLPAGGWPWSSHRYYVEGGEPAVAAPFIHAVLRRFSDTLDEARRRYAAFVAEGLAGEQWKNFYTVKEGCFIGSDAWVAETKTRLRGVPALSRLPTRPTAERLLFAVAEETGVLPTRLTSAERSREISQIRQLFAFMSLHLWQQSQVTIAKALHKDPSAISHLLRNTLLSKDHPLVQRILARISVP